jgi:hypothetical protein
VSPANRTLVTLNIAPNGTLTAAGCLRGSASTDLNCGGPTTTTPGLNGANSVDVAPDGITVYVTASSGGTSSVSYLTTYDRTPAGALTLSQCFHSTGAASDADTAAPPCNANPAPVFGLNGADGVRTSPDDKNVYVASGVSAPATGNSLVTFDRNTTTGDLSSNRCLKDAGSTTESCAGTAVGLRGAFDIAIAPDSQFLYVTARTGSDVAEFSRNTTTGDLTQLAGNDKCIGRTGNTDCTGNNTAKGLGGASGMALSPNGLFAYVAGPTDSAVAEFTVERPPTCDNVGPISTPHDQPVTFTLPCTDPNPNDAVTCALNVQPTNGTVTQSSPGSCTVTFTPNTGFAGSDSFTYHATDSAGQSSNVATASVTVATTGTPTVTIADAAVDESAGTMTFQLTLSAPIGGGPVTVTYETRDGTAAAPGDYTAQNSMVTFPTNTTTATITVPIINDATHEGTEHFFVDLTGSSPSTAIARPTAKGTIADDDATSIAIADTTAAENAGNANFTVTLSNPSASTVRATYSTTDGSATSPSDFTAQSAKTVSFAPGEISKQISIPVVNDNNPEQTEQFTVNLSSPTGGATLGDSHGTGTIQDEDKPTISVSDTGVAEGNSGTRNAAFTVSLSTPISRTVTVNYATANGTATTADGDYDSGTGVLTFAPGQTSKTVNVVVDGDAKPESDETFTLNLSAPTEATIADNSGTATILDDDTVATQGGLSISNTSVAEGDAGTRNATFTVSLSQPSSGAVTVKYATADGSALAASDYNSSTDTLTFTAGQTSKPVPVEIKGDRKVEPDETFTVKLSNATGAPISDDTGTGTIVNDDPVRLRPRVTSSVKPKRDRKAPYRFVVRGKVVRPAGVSRAGGCTGAVRVRVINGPKTLYNQLAGVASNCSYQSIPVFSKRPKFRSGRLVVKIKFLGNRFLLPRSAPTRSARAG